MSLIRLWVLLLFSMPVFASYQDAIITGMTTSANGYTWRSSGAAFTNRAANASAYFTAFGSRFSIPATVRASTALTSLGVAGNLLSRANPWVIGVATSLWLVQQGLQLIDGQTTVLSNPTEPAGLRYFYRTNDPAYGGIASSYWEACKSFGYSNSVCSDGSISITWGSWFSPPTCPDGKTLTNGMCVGGSRPVTPADLAPLYLSTPSDDALSEIAATPDGLPVEAPTLSPTDIVISQPYLKTDGTTAQERASITPAPTDDNPYRLKVDTYEKTLEDAQGNPIPEPDQPITETQHDQTDCDKYPTSAGCSSLGEIPSAEPVGTSSIPVLFTPITLAGSPAAACPAPVTVSLSGHAITYDYDVACRYADMFRPIILALAWLGAAYTVITGTRNA